LTGLTLRDINLLVGKNASGKTRILNVILHLAESISGKLVLSPSGMIVQRQIFNGKSHLFFDNDGQRLEYELEVIEGKVVREVFTVDGNSRLDRGPGGEGWIWAEKEGKKVEFQTPDDQLAVVTRRDVIQHSYFEPLHQWANSLYYYAFSTLLGKDRAYIFIKSDSQKVDTLNAKDTNQVVDIYRKGKEVFGERYVETVKKDFEAIGYPIENVDIGVPQSVKIQAPMYGEITMLFVKEADLPGITDQQAMSNGMFRALSIIIQINYAVLADTPSCILIDDIGEGLDFDRSCGLIDVLISKAEHSSVQLVMATNDRFVMNQVPLEAWSIIDREANHINIRNYSNSKEIFDNFKFTGLNNFDFLVFDYLHAGKRNE
jgi:predicted ATPase